MFFDLQTLEDVFIPPVYPKILSGVTSASVGVLQCRFYVTKVSALKERNGNTIPKEEYGLVIESIYVDYQSLKEQVMGVMKAIEPEKDFPFDTAEFVQKQKGTQ